MTGSHNKPSVSFVIPAYNEEANIEEVVRRSFAVLDSYCSGGEVVVIDDGSRDSTGTILSRLVPDFQNRLRVLRNASPIGCHPSMWKGSVAAQSEWIFFIPADKQIVPEELPKFLAATAGADLVYSYRRSRADPWYRKVAGRLYNLVERVTLGLHLDDTHSSVLVSRRVVRALEGSIQSMSAVLPAELAARSMHLGFVIRQVEIEHYPRVAGVATGITSKDIFRLPGDLVRFAIRMRRLSRQARGTPG
jgi:undecaprenyl-phosphate 4-deoxy-4-formamido-L-arabinose transferase